MNIKMILSYDGTHFLGWQEGKEGPTIEGTLRKVLEEIYQEPIKLQAASRTDAGVHAEGQVVNFKPSKEKKLNLLLSSLNQLLPKALRVTSLELVDDSFHPTLDAIGKEYHYKLTCGAIQSPFKRHFFWHSPSPLDYQKMKTAATYFIGTHDFTALSNFPRPPDRIRTLHQIEITVSEDEMLFIIKGDHFLYKMVRNIVGTLVDVGRGRLSLIEAKNLLLSRDRRMGGVTAPAHGLILWKVFY